MRRISVSLLLGLGLLAGASALAQSHTVSAAAELSAGHAATLSRAAAHADGTGFTLAPVERMQLKAQPASAFTAPAAKPAPRAPRLGVPSIDDVAGYYVGTYSTLSTGSFDGGSTMQIVKDAEGDSVTVKYFWNNCDVRALYNGAEGKIYIPRQYVYTDQNLGALDLAVASQTGAPDYKAQIVGTVAEDGTIDFSDIWWGVYVQASGTNKDKFVAAYYNLTLKRPTGTFMYKTSSGQQAGYCVLVEQTTANVLKVTNLFNSGLETTARLDRDRTATFSNQTVLINGSGAWTLIKCLAFNDQGNLTNYSTTITTDPAAEGDNKTLRWTDWSLLCAEARSYAGHLTDAVLTVDKGISYPQLSVTDFEGAGTEADPYRISTLDHLILLADKVNNDTEYTGNDGNCTRSFLGKYFALTDDIDMDGYMFDPIGAVYKQRFAGTFDGKGHTIKGLNVDGGAKYYCGLFGMCDTLSVIKNLTLESPVIKSEYFSAGSVAGWTWGSLENITVNNPAVTGDRSGNGAIAGIVSGSIRDSRVKGGAIMAAGFLGGAVGEVHGGISNVTVDGTYVYMSGTGSPAGGVVGNLLEHDGDNLWFKGLLSVRNVASDGGQILGGVAGMIQNVALRNSFMAGALIGYSNDSEVGGVVARLYSGAIENCYSSGLVHCYTRRGGGLVGLVGLGSSNKNPRIANCYTSATVEIETYQYDTNRFSEAVGQVSDGVNCEIENMYFDRQVVYFGSKKYGVPTSFLTSAQGPDGFSADSWVFTAGAYPRLRASADSEAAKFSASAVDMAQGDTFKKISQETPLTALGDTKFFFAKKGILSTEGYYSKIVDNNKIVIGEEFGIDTLYVVNGDVQTFHYLNIAPIPFEGDGSEANPFLLKTKADILALAEATTVKRQMFDSLYFAITNDIDMELDPAFDGICADNSSAAASIKFQGVIDGRGHTIDRIYLNRVIWSKEPTETAPGTLSTTDCRNMSGLVGRLGERGVIRNLNIGAGSKFEMFGMCGAFVGQLDGLVENCRNYADVTGYSCWVAGIAGMVNKSGRILNCYNAGDIRSGYSNVGGIAGTSTGIIENCVNTGDISATPICTNFSNHRQRVGGISGGSNASAIRNCVNFGTVTATLNNAGGIVGSMEGTSSAGAAKDNLENCFNYGNVYCGNGATTGAVIGLAGTKNAVNNYYDVQMTGLAAGSNADVEGIAPTETAALVSGQAFKDCPADVWDYTAGSYPVLKAFADEPEVAAARKVYASLAAGETVADLHTGAALCDDAAWTLSDGSQFKIADGRLVVPQNVSAVVTDTLVAVNAAGVRRPVFIQALPAMPLTGKGTKEAPYLINNTDDWNALAAYISATGKNLQDEHVSLTADLDFTDAAITPMGADGVTVFAGDLDGGNHSVKGLALKSKANQSMALFGTIAAEGAVRNLTVEGTLSCTHTYAAPVVDKLYGTLDNVTSNVTVTTNKAQSSGVVGYAYTGAVLDKVVFAGKLSASAATIGGLAAISQPGVTFRDCVFKGVISHTASLTKATSVYVGGFVGSAGASTFENCRSEGEITVASAEWANCVAGFLGNAIGAKGNGLYSFTGCSNATPLSAAGKVAGFIGGYPTSSSAAANAQYVLTDCYNEADITNEATKSASGMYTGGVVSAYTPGSRFIRCHNTGTIISNVNTYAAGIAAYYQGTPGSTATPDSVLFTDCYNAGMIVADGNQGGGIAGYVSGKVILENCRNTADSEGNRMLGGICSGFSGTGPVLRNCYNTGNITGKADRLGGLIAWGQPVNGLVEGCWNSGNITSLSEVQSDKTNASPAFEVAGLAANSGATFRNCYNVGTVKGLARVAGLVASPVKARTQFLNCYNAGKIDAPADSCGSIIGNDVSNGKVWTEDNKMVNTYYLSTNVCDKDRQYTDAKALSHAELAALELGEGYESSDKYTWPVVKGFGNHEVAMFHAAHPVFDGEDTQANVTGAFHLGGSPVVSWSSDCADLAIQGSEATFSKTFSGKIVLTAKAGDLSKTYELVANNAQSGVSDITADDTDIVSRRWYNAAGIEVLDPVPGTFYLVRELHADGRTTVAKRVAR